MTISIAPKDSRRPTGRIYINNRNDNGFSQTFQSAAERIAFHLGNSIGPTETIVGLANRNMIIVPGPTGIINILHHGFGATAERNFLLIFAQGRLENGTIFKSIHRTEVVVQLVGNETGRRLGGQTLDNDESADAFANLASHPANQRILRGRPNHAVFLSKGIGFCHNHSDAQDQGRGHRGNHSQESCRPGIGRISPGIPLGVLAPIQLEDVPDTAVMNHNIRTIKDKEL